MLEQNPREKTSLEKSGTRPEDKKNIKENNRLKVIGGGSVSWKNHLSLKPEYVKKNCERNEKKADAKINEVTSRIWCRSTLSHIAVIEWRGNRLRSSCSEVVIFSSYTQNVYPRNINIT